MVLRTHCMRFVGQHVVFRTNDGLRHGVLHSVTNDGVIIRPIGSGSTRLANTKATEQEVDLLQNMPQVRDDVTEAWFPFLFFPFFALWWLWPWAWWW